MAKLMAVPAKPHRLRQSHFGILSVPLGINEARSFSTTSAREEDGVHHNICCGDELCVSERDSSDRVPPCSEAIVSEQSMSSCRSQLLGSSHAHASCEHVCVWNVVMPNSAFR